MVTTTRTVRYEEWLNMPIVDDAIEEVVNGEIRIMPSNKWKHTIIIENLSDALKAQVDRNGVRIAASVCGLIIRKAPLTSRVRDLAVFITQNIVDQDGYAHSAPELVIEVANTRRLMNEKIGDYESIATPELWIVSPEAQTVEVLLLQSGKLVTEQVLSRGQLSPKLFPGVAVDVAAIWPD
ncbi:MAG TPA: Uma2 family endonuclease [Bryobacteraceae bacterium]|jgi:Uma2 family endonuclease|nr:Uma2 family endonuclease [Bryobacteraceae bacterium]